MDKLFANIQSEGKNTVDGLVQWMKDAEVIDGNTVTEEQARSSLGGKAKVDLGTFKDTLAKLASGAKQDVEGFTRRLSGLKNNKMDQMFEELSKSGKTGVNSIVAWLQEAKIIEKSKESEDKIKKLFSNVKDQAKVTAEEFNTGITALAAEQNTTFEQLSKQLADQGPKILQALQAAATTFRENMNST